MGISLTEEQRAAVQTQGKLIVSASAGSGKTFVMINKLADLIEGGADLDEILAVTFTNKAAAQMKEKLRLALIERIAHADEGKKAHLKEQLSKISSASVSTIHSFCSTLLRSYFYVFDFDCSFELIAGESEEATYMNRAMERLFDRLYESEDEKFYILLSCYRKKRSDASLKNLIIDGFKKVRDTVGYRQKLEQAANLYTPSGFKTACDEYRAIAEERLKNIRKKVKSFYNGFFPENKEAYDLRFEQINAALDAAIECEDIFAPLPKLCDSKPRDSKADAEIGKRYKKFHAEISEEYSAVYKGLSTREEEESAFYESGKTAVAFSDVLLQFDREYAQVKREEGKLDFSDLEQYTLRLLENERTLDEIKRKYKYIYVDEYQDVNPVQEHILSAITGDNTFLVGDVKQAIYGFRGSKSFFFAQKFENYQRGEEHALKLSNNFRSSDKVIQFVNALFTDVMREHSCGIDYESSSLMLSGGGYPKDDGYAKVHVFGKDEKDKKTVSGVYSVTESAQKKSSPSREGLAVVQAVKKSLGGQYYDLNKKCYRQVEPGDICVLTRKRKNDSATGIVRALTDAGFSVSGSQGANICDFPEVKKMLDVLSYIDNSQQDIPLVTALLSPLGRLSENELAEIKIYANSTLEPKEGERITYRQCCLHYAQKLCGTTKTAQKLKLFYEKIDTLREYSQLFGAASLIDKVLEETSWEAQYSKNGGIKLKNIRTLAAEAYSSSGELSLSAFLQKIKAGGYKISAPEGSSSNSIKVMTMHASKGLEFPVVIIADVCRSFRGEENSELLFDEAFGFVTKAYNAQAMVKRDTLLGRLVKIKSRREEYRNEANLYYVACTRAMYGLHVLASELDSDFTEPDIYTVRSYSQMADLNKFNPEYMELDEGIKERVVYDSLISAPDLQVLEDIKSRFNKPYAYVNSVNLPVKSSASSILKILGGEEEYYTTQRLFPDELSVDATSAEVGTAYHRFLQLCDFSKNSIAEVESQLNGFVNGGQMSAEQAALISVKKLSAILNMPVFAGLKGAELYREREFLCKLPANAVLPTCALDEILIQGAIDLLAFTNDGCKIIDYKYSKKSDEEIKKTYAPQLALYKKAVSVICKIDERTISTTIVNLVRLTEIPL